MTTPANPTPEPTPLTDAAKFRIFWDHNSAHYRVTIPNLDKADVVPAELSADLERQLSDTRRRLAEAEKERDGLRKSGRCVCRFEEPEPQYHKGFKIEPTGDSMIWTNRCSFHQGQVDKKLTALRNAADGMARELETAKRFIQTMRMPQNITDAALLVVKGDGVITGINAATASYAALISEGNQDSNASNSPTASRESQG